ncbi:MULTISPECIES: protein YdgV [Kluyvera]
MMRSNTADNCNFMDNMFRTYISTQFTVFPSFSAFCGEHHWRNAL